MNIAICWPNGVTAPFQDEQVECVKEELTTAELQQKVKEYNAQVNSNLFMNSVSGLFVCLVLHMLMSCRRFIICVIFFLFVLTEQRWFLHWFHKSAVQVGETGVCHAI